MTRGTFNVRIERVGRPEVKNLMLAPKQFDRVNRDLEIRDLYNMEDAFALGESYPGAYRARLDANLAFWDGLDGKIDWPASNGAHPLTEVVLQDFLVVDVNKPYAEQGSFLEIELAALRGRSTSDLRRTGPQRRRHGHHLHPARDGRYRITHPGRGRRCHPPGIDSLSLPGRTQSGSAHASRAPPLTWRADGLAGESATQGPALELDDIQGGVLHERPSPYVGTYLLLRIDDRAAGRELVRRLHRLARPSARRPIRPARPRSRSPSPTTV